jgi:hypothetical protein
MSQPGEGKTTIRQIVTAIRDELREGDIQPERAAEMLNTLSSILGNISDEIRKRDLAYNQKLLECYHSEAKANRAKILAETSPEYQSMRTAKDMEKEAVEMIRSLKYFLKVKEREWMHTPR